MGINAPTPSTHATECPRVDALPGLCEGAIIGPRLRARTLPAQQGEAAIAVQVLNRMIRVAKPISVRVA